MTVEEAINELIAPNIRKRLFVALTGCKSIIVVTFVIESDASRHQKRYTSNANDGKYHVTTLPPFPRCKDPDLGSGDADVSRGSRDHVRPCSLG